MSEEERVIIDTNCGCSVTRSDDSASYKTTLHLCAWHSRWIQRATTVVCSGEVKNVQVTINFAVTQ